MDLLNDRERFLIYQLDSTYKDRYQQDPCANPSLVYFVGDRFEFSCTWSAASGRIPTFRKNPAKFIHRQSLKIYTGQEKLAIMGWPVNGTLAQGMLTTTVPSLDPARSDFLAGNSMHVANCAIVMMVALSYFGYRDIK